MGEVRAEKTDRKENRYFYFRKAQMSSLKKTSEVAFTWDLSSRLLCGRRIVLEVYTHVFVISVYKCTKLLSVYLKYRFKKTYFNILYIL